VNLLNIPKLRFRAQIPCRNLYVCLAEYITGQSLTRPEAVLGESVSQCVSVSVSRCIGDQRSVIRGQTSKIREQISDVERRISDDR